MGTAVMDLRRPACLLVALVVATGECKKMHSETIIRILVEVRVGRACLRADLPQAVDLQLRSTGRRPMLISACLTRKLLERPTSMDMDS